MNTLLAWPISCAGRRPRPRRTASRSRRSRGRRSSAGCRPGSPRRAEVGFESGRTIGRSVPAASARRTASSNVPPTPVVPTRTVGRTPLDRLDAGRELGREAVPGVGGRRERQLALRRRRGRRGRSWTSPRESTSTSARRVVRVGHPGVEHRQAEEPGDPDPGRAGPDQHDPRVGEGRRQCRAARPGRPRRPPRPCPGCRR